MVRSPVNSGAMLYIPALTCRTLPRLLFRRTILGRSARFMFYRMPSSKRHIAMRPHSSPAAHAQVLESPCWRCGWLSRLAPTRARDGACTTPSAHGICRYFKGRAIGGSGGWGAIQLMNGGEPVDDQICALVPIVCEMLSQRSELWVNASLIRPKIFGECVRSGESGHCHQTLTLRCPIGIPILPSCRAEATINAILGKPQTQTWSLPRTT